MNMNKKRAIIYTIIIIVISIALNLLGNWYAINYERGYNALGGEDMIWILTLISIFILWNRYNEVKPSYDGFEIKRRKRYVYYKKRR